MVFSLLKGQVFNIKAVIQRVKNANCVIDGIETASIENGFIILLGVHENDTEEDAKILARKTANLRIFEDEEGKMNKSILDMDYSALVISQFTLLADCKKGNRPSFIQAARPDKAIPLYELYMSELSANGIHKIGHGEFGADMKIGLVNDGPVTIVYDTNDWK